MEFSLPNLFFIFFIVMMLQPILMGRVFALRRVQAIRVIERLRGSRVITMIHRQEKRSLFGFNMSNHIDLEDAQSIISAIKATPDNMPIDLVMHTPGGLVIAAMQIARAVEAHPAKVTVFVPIYAMSGGTLIAMAADEIVMGEFSMLGPIDPQIMGISAASVVAARDAKPIEHVSDIALVLADVSDKAIAQVRRGAIEIMTPRMAQDRAEELAATLTCGKWTHDYALTPHEATELGLPITVDMPPEILSLMKLYPSPVKQSVVEFLPFDPPGKKMR
ncbi:Serine dehydrogenase proteinase [Roseovarius litorisediminis]|uniref:Serine dehydrogenase proteinase n=1 Tax=Roseovarius litorisediminis TaxID=1312363 RepID=A0A1Y5T080_9RHOB|nr:ATP-dependent Clp protease proteolytic subunit [Roseovarius litorisediminis]SLN50653.1 Serine dehydrogenase proteinase [Roseovarius litorisediminis]